MQALPVPYRGAAKAFERYFMYNGGITDGDTLVTMLSDFADMWERASIDGTPISELVCCYDMEFSEIYTESYGGVKWIDKERARLIKAVQEAEQEEKK